VSGPPLTVVVYGTPAPQGSKRHVGRGVLVESSDRLWPWREAVRHATVDALADQPDWCPDAEVHLSATFYLRRPHGHYRTGVYAGMLRADTPGWPATRPDLDKLLRSTLDALTDAGAVADDARVVRLTAAKRYADDRAPGALLLLGAP